VFFPITFAYPESLQGGMDLKTLGRKFFVPAPDRSLHNILWHERQLVRLPHQSQVNSGVLAFTIDNQRLLMLDFKRAAARSGVASSGLFFTQGQRLLQPLHNILWSDGCSSAVSSYSDPAQQTSSI